MATKNRFEKTKQYAEVKASLISEMEALGKVSPFHMAKVDRYMSLWVQLKEFESSLLTDGYMVLDEKRNQMVENRAASLRLQTEAAMLKLEAEMLKPDPTRPPAGDDDDEL